MEMRPSCLVYRGTKEISSATEGRSGPGEGYSALARIVRTIARRHGLHHGYDELGEPIIPGKRGHLYLDGDQWRWALVPPSGLAPWSSRVLTNAKADPRLTLLVEGVDEAIFAVRDEADLRDIGIRWCQASKRRPPNTADHLRKHRKARLQGAETAAEARQRDDATETTDPASPGENEGDSAREPKQRRRA